MPVLSQGLQQVCSFSASKPKGRVGGLGETSPPGDQAFTSMCKSIDYQRIGQGREAEKVVLQGFRMLTTCSRAHERLGPSRRTKKGPTETQGLPSMQTVEAEMQLVQQFSALAHLCGFYKQETHNIWQARHSPSMQKNPSTVFCPLSL